MKNFFYEIWAFWPFIDNNTTTKLKAQKGSKYIVK